MLLKRIFLENLRSYERQEISFPEGSILLSGDIGSGKTTVLLAIEFALFGLQPSQKGGSLLRAGADYGKVTLELEINDQDIKIERTLKKSNKSIAQDFASITIANEIFEGSVTEIKNRVLKLLNYPQEFSRKTNLLYKFTVYTPQEEMKQIILEPGEIRLNTLRHVFGIDKYKRIEENSEILTNKLREKIRINEAVLQNLEADKEGLKRKIEMLFSLKGKQEQALADYQKSIELRGLKESEVNEIQEKINEKKVLETEKIKSNLLISEKKQQAATLENNLRSLKLQIEEARKISLDLEEFNLLNQRINFQKNKEEELQREYIQIIGRINAEESKKRETELFKDKISRLHKCPTCLQEVPEDYKKNIFNKTEIEMQALQRNINELTIKKNQLIEQTDSVKKIKENLEKRKSELDLLKVRLENLREKEQRILEIEKQINSVEKDLEMLSKHVDAIDSSILEYEKYSRIYEEREKELKEAKKNEESLAIRKAEINKEVQFLEEQIREKQREIEKKQESQRVIEKLKKVEYWISEKFINFVLFTEKQVMLTLKEEFSKLFSRWFSVLVSDSLSARLDDNFSPIIEQQDYELDYSFLSGGERTAIALAYRLGLNQVINSILSSINTSDLVILDEPTEGFSSQQLDKMKEVLNQLKVRQLILVSHEQKIEEFVDSIIRFRKEDGITKLEG